MTPTEREAYAKVLDPRYRQIMQGEPSVTAWLRNAGPSLTQPGTMRPGWARLQDIQQAKHEIGNIDPVTPEIRAKWDELTAAEEQIQKANPWLLDSGGENPTGQTLYEALARRGSPASASKALREAGIPGMTYIGDSSGARNYVTYDDALMNIKGRYPSMAEWQKAKGAK